jgi:hypothetical protein
MSVFASISKPGHNEETMTDGSPSVDEAALDRTMELLVREAEHIDGDDPREAAKLMRKIAESTGIGVNDRLEEALGRLEGGEDPERIDEEMGDVLSDENLFSAEGKAQKGKRKKSRNRVVDETFYDLE